MQHVPNDLSVDHTFNKQTNTQTDSFIYDSVTTTTALGFCFSLHFNGHFPGESGLAGVYRSNE